MLIPRKATKAARKKRKTKILKTLASYKNEDGTQKENSIERRVRVLLEDMVLHFTQEKSFIWSGKKRVFDFYVNDGTMSVAIEIMGTYWHSIHYLEGKQPYSELSKLQKKNLRNDKFKALMMKELGIPLLTFTEDEVNKNIHYVRERINQFFNLPV